MRGLNLRSFKKVGGDESHSVMQHEDGHQIKILHKPLSTKMKQDLMKLPVAKMAEGGQPSSSPSGIPGGPGSPAIDSDKAKGIEKGATESGVPSAGQAWKNLKEGLGFADGGPVQDIDPSDAPASTPPPAANFIDQQLQASAPDTGVVSQMPANAQPGVSAIPDSAPQAAPDAPGASAPADAPSTPPPPADSDPYGYGASQKVLMQGIGLGEKGADEAAKAAKVEGDAQLKAHEDFKKAYTDFNERSDKELADVNNERVALSQDIQNQHIDPNRYFANKSLGSKIATGIGLLLGGLGSGATGGPNQALQFLQSNIDRDIDAQKQELGKKENLLSANFKRYGNIMQAREMTRIQMNDMLANQLGTASALAKSPMAKAQADMTKSQILTQNAQAVGNFARQKALMGMVNNQNPERIPATIQMLKVAGQKDLADDMEKKYVPGIGLAQTPVPQEVRDRLTGMQTFQQKAQNLLEFAKKHAGTVLDRATVNQGKALAADLQGAYRQATHGGVYKEGEQHFINGIVGSDPTVYLNKTRFQAPLQAVVNSVRGEQNVLHKNLGLPAIQAPAEFAVKDGVRYMKVPGGWQKAPQ